MKAKSKTEIWIEPSRRPFLHLPDNAARMLCSICPDGELMVPAEHAAVPALSRRDAYRRSVAGQTHFAET